MRRRAVGILASLAAALLARPAAGDDGLVDAGAVQSYLVISHLGKKGTPVTGLAARWMFVDGHGEVGLGGSITAWKPLWGPETDSFGFDLDFNAQFSGSFKEGKAHIMPCGGFAVGLRNMFLEPVESSRLAVSGVGVTLHLGVHGYFGRRSGLYWRLVGFGSAHLHFPEPGWSAGGGAELSLGIYID